MAKDEPNGTPEYEIKASNEGNGQPTSKKSIFSKIGISKNKAKASQNESQCECKDNTRNLLCRLHGDKRWWT